VRRAKRPPPNEVIEEAIVIADIFMEGRRSEIEHLIQPLVVAAMGEYLRRIPKARKANKDPWVEVSIGETTVDSARGFHYLSYERDYQCFFCRRSLNTLPAHRVPNRKFLDGIRAHAEECGIRMLAGMIDPHPPLPGGQPGL